MVPFWLLISCCQYWHFWDSIPSHFPHPWCRHLLRHLHHQHPHLLSLDFPLRWPYHILLPHLHSHPRHLLEEVRRFPHLARHHLSRCCFDRLLVPYLCHQPPGHLLGCQSSSAIVEEFHFFRGFDSRKYLCWRPYSGRGNPCLYQNYW